MGPPWSYLAQGNKDVLYLAGMDDRPQFPKVCPLFHNILLQKSWTSFSLLNTISLNKDALKNEIEPSAERVIIDKNTASTAKGNDGA